MLADDRSLRSAANRGDVEHSRAVHDVQMLKALLAGVQGLLCGRFEYFDMLLANHQHELRRNHLDTNNRIDDVEAAEIQAARRVETLEMQITNVQGDFLESLRSERQVADVKRDSFEAVAKSQLNDMSDCIQDQVEHMLSALHQT